MDGTIIATRKQLPRGPFGTQKRMRTNFSSEFYTLQLGLVVTTYAASNEQQLTVLSVGVVGRKFFCCNHATYRSHEVPFTFFPVF